MNRIILLALVLSASACAGGHAPTPWIPIATLPLGAADDTLPCRTARPELRRPPAPQPLVHGDRMRYQQLPAPVPEIRGGETNVHRGILSPTGDAFALQVMVSGRTELTLHNARTGAALGVVDSVWAPDPRALAFSRDGRWIAVGGAYGDVTIVSPGWHERAVLPHGAHRPAQMPPSWPGGGEYPWGIILSVDFSPDGREVLTLGQDGNLILWDLASRRPRWIRGLHTPEGYPLGAMQAIFLPDGRVLVNGSGALEVRSRRTGERAGLLRVPVGEVPVPHGGGTATLHSSVIGLAASADGALVVAHGRTGSHGEADGEPPATGDWIRTWWWSECPDEGRPISVEGTLGSIAVSSDHRWIAAIGRDAIHVWDTWTGRERFRISEAVTRPIAGPWNLGVSFSPDGRFLYTFHNHERPVIVWDLAES